MALKDWAETVLGEPLTLPIRGKTYPIPALGWLSAQKLRENSERIAELLALIADEKLPDDERQLDETERKRIRDNPPTVSDEEFLTMLLGDQLQAMREDDVPRAAILHAARCAHVDAVKNREAAERLWNEGPDPEVQAAEKAALASLTTSPDTPRPAPTSSTKRPANIRSTNSRGKASRSASTKSSTRRHS